MYARDDKQSIKKTDLVQASKKSINNNQTFNPRNTTINIKTHLKNKNPLIICTASTLPPIYTRHEKQKTTKNGLKKSISGPKVTKPM
jgi:hypothetical protein